MQIRESVDPGIASFIPSQRLSTTETIPIMGLNLAYA